MSISQRERKHIEILFRNRGFTFADEKRIFLPYTSGMIGSYYVNSESVMRNGKDYHRVVENLADMVDITLRKNSKDSDFVISGGERRDWIFSYPVAAMLSQPHLTICKNTQTFGADVRGRKVIHVADLNNEGSSLRDLWIPTIKKLGGKIDEVFFYVDRSEKGVKIVRQLGLKSRSIITLDVERWRYMLEQGMIIHEQYESVMEYRANPIEWGKKVLKSERGIETLAKLVNSLDHEIRKKGKRIVDFYEIPVSNSLTF